jgi:CheY-like chemotaxis protein
MGGEIGVTSTMGVGACFWMKVPAPAVEPRAACVDDTARPPLVNLDGLKLLVADDHETNRELVRLIFTGLGASVTLVENGQDAVIAARNETFDAILLDVRMPIMGGVEACRRIREAGGENRKAAIFAFTADADLEQPGMIGGQGFDGLISKPVNPAAMVTAILQELAHQDADPGLVRAGG